MITVIMSILWLMIGIVVGIVIEHLKTISGTLKIDTSNPEKDIYRLEIENLDDIPKKKRIILKVDNSQK